MFETALRAAAGEGFDEHQAKISELWAGFSAVAAANPYAWVQRALSAEEIRTPGPDNRMIGLPYPKYMNSNNDVDQAAALLMCSVGTGPQPGRARGALGLPACRCRHPRPLLRVEPGRLRVQPGGAHRRPARDGAGRRRDRRRRHRRPVLVLPGRGAGRCGRARPRARPPAHAHRRAVVRRRAVEQLCDARHRRDRAGPAPAARRHGPRVGQRRLSHEARAGRVRHPRHRPRASATTRPRTRSTPSPAASWPSRPRRLVRPPSRPTR